MNIILWLAFHCGYSLSQYFDYVTNALKEFYCSPPRPTMYLEPSLVSTNRTNVGHEVNIPAPLEPNYTLKPLREGPPHE